MNYFDFFEMPHAFILDEALLKQRFYENSKKYHPDFFTLEPEEKQVEILELSTFNNQAYRTLSDFDKRMEYLLNLKGALEEEGKNQVPQDFLMEMMDINEGLIELEFDFEAAKLQEILQSFQQIEQAIYQEAEPFIEGYDDKKTTPEELSKVKDYFLKKKYLLRIQENVSKFATQ